MRCLIATLLMAYFLCFPALATNAAYREIKTIELQQEFDTTKNWRVTAYQTAEKDIEFSETPARICFSAQHQEPTCTDITSTLPNDKMRYAYQQVKELSVIAKPHLVKLTAEFSAGGSGSLDQVSFWKYEKATDSFQQAGVIMLTEQGEYQLFNAGTMAGLLVTADAYWDKNETHFSPHRFYIDVYRYDGDSGYIKLFGYLTKTKYPSLDDIDKIDVISHEVTHITTRLAN